MLLAVHKYADLYSESSLRAESAGLIASQQNNLPPDGRQAVVRKVVYVCLVNVDYALYCA